MYNLIVIFIGGGLGAVCRYLAAISLKSLDLTLPLATFGVNIVGSLILGFVAAMFWHKVPMHDTLRLAIAVGFCGGLTTFSTFSWETFEMIKQGDFFLAAFYVFFSVLVCLVAVSLGAFLSRYV